MTTNTNTTLHPWTKAGLGDAPFRFAGYYESRGPIRCDDGSEVGAPGQPMGTCDFCGQGIANCFAVESKDGKRSIVGQDCIRRLGSCGTTLRAAAVRARRDVERTQRIRASAADVAARRAEREEYEAAVAANLRATTLAAHPGLAEALRSEHEIVREIAKNFEQHGRISPKQIDLVIRLHVEASTTWGPVPEGRARFVGTVVRSWLAQSSWSYDATHLVDIRVEASTGPWILRLRGGSGQAHEMMQAVLARRAAALASPGGARAGFRSHVAAL
jgi:hypothetical protein